MTGLVVTIGVESVVVPVEECLTAGLQFVEECLLNIIEDVEADEGIDLLSEGQIQSDPVFFLCQLRGNLAEHMEDAPLVKARRILADILLVIETDLPLEFQRARKVSRLDVPPDNLRHPP